MVTQEELEKMSPEQIAELQKQNCIFCKIIKGEIPSQKVFENDKVIAILDINPAKKGHVLVLPKDHFPILPVIPPEVFKELFASAKILASAIKQAVLVPAVSIFIANGAIAGQQSPHFLFHIVPRDNPSDAKNFTLPQNESLLPEQEKILPSLQQNLSIMMKKHFAREGKPSAASAPSARGPAPTPQQLSEMKHEHITKMIEDNKDVRDLIKSNPEEFKKVITQNPQLVELFKGINIEELSKNLNALDAAPVSEPSVVVPVETESQISQQSTKQSPVVEEIEEHVEDSVQTISKPVQTPATAKHASDLLHPSSPRPKPEVFLGENPLNQKNKIFAYFEEKPKAKALLMKDPAYFKELLQDRPDVQELFVDVNVDKLSEKLNEVAKAQEDGNDK